MADPNLRLPDFLVIGAMKAGTTTLCNDLLAHPDIFFPSVKEPHTLVHEDVLTKTGRSRYAALFRQARPAQLCGEGSTGYSKYPFSARVPERARKVLGPDLKLIYIMRDPIDRSLSHHYHLLRSGVVSTSFERAVEKRPMIIGASCYGRQLQAWLEHFSRDNILLLRFEDYMANRQQRVEQTWSFLGCTAGHYPIEEKTYNIGSEEKLPPSFLRGFRRRITHAQWYKRNLAHLWPENIKARVKGWLYRVPAVQPEPPSADDLERMLETFTEDLAALRHLAGPDLPLWSAEDLRRKVV